MKRSEMLKLIANQLNFLNGTFDGLKDIFTPAELAKADVILTTLEEAGMQPPSKCDTGKCSEIGCGNEWEEENETK